MVLALLPELPPLTTNPDGLVLIAETRVTLDTVVLAFQQGLTPEEIVYRYPSLKLVDIYGTITFYLKHQVEVENYLEHRKQQAQEIKVINEARFKPQKLQERLLSRAPIQ